jgi:AraC-like DNA-binding protein
MPGCFTTVEVTDPRRITESIWQNLPQSEKAAVGEREATSRDYGPLDRRRFRVEPESYRTVHAIANVGALRAARIADRRATLCTVRPPTAEAPYLYIWALERGEARLVLPGWDEPAVGNAATGVIWRGEPGAQGAHSDENIRHLLWLPARLLSRQLEALLDGQQVESVAFRPMFDQTRGAGATIRRMVGFLFAELEHSDSLLSNEIAIRSFEENLTLCLLLGLPHNYAAALERPKAVAAPGNVRKAEAFMRTHADTPLTIVEIAEVAGCGVRALQIAFQRFRGTTPMRALQQARLDRARQEIVRVDRTESLARIAAAYGFSNPTRFARLFRRRYGVYPSEMPRARRDPLAG